MKYQQSLVYLLFLEFMLAALAFDQEIILGKDASFTEAVYTVNHNPSIKYRLTVPKELSHIDCNHAAFNDVEVEIAGYGVMIFEDPESCFSLSNSRLSLADVNIKTLGETKEACFDLENSFLSTTNISVVTYGQPLFNSVKSSIVLSHSDATADEHSFATMVHSNFTMDMTTAIGVSYDISKGSKLNIKDSTWMSHGKSFISDSTLDVNSLFFDCDREFVSAAVTFTNCIIKGPELKTHEITLSFDSSTVEIEGDVVFHTHHQDTILLENSSFTYSGDGIRLSSRNRCFSLDKSKATMGHAYFDCSIGAHLKGASEFHVHGVEQAPKKKNCSQSLSSGNVCDFS